MGAAQHKEVGSPRSQPWPNHDATPPRESCLSQRQLPFDPRSPTEEVVRTPILVSKTPEGLTLLDPRSPTEGVDRTPMALLLTKDVFTPTGLTMEVETAAHCSAGDTAPLCLPEDSQDVDMISPIKADPDHPLDIPDVGDNDLSPLLQSAQLPQFKMVEPTPLQTRPAALPKQLFPGNPPASLPCKQPAVLRSPLGLVARDTNSPRSIVQTKQRMQVSKSYGGVRGRHNMENKENVAH